MCGPSARGEGGAADRRTSCRSLWGRRGLPLGQGAQAGFWGGTWAGCVLLQTGFRVGREGAERRCRSIPRIDRSEPIPHNCLEIDNISLSCSIAAAIIPLGFLDTITCPWRAPLPSCLFPDLRFNGPEVFVSFIISHLQRFLKGGGGVTLLGDDNSRQFLMKNLDFFLRLGNTTGETVYKLDQGPYHTKNIKEGKRPSLVWLGE